jgi:hypothetical protein
MNFGDSEVTRTLARLAAVPKSLLRSSRPDSEMPLYLACCRCGRERDDLADFYADPPTQPRRFAGFLE